MRSVTTPVRRIPVLVALLALASLAGCARTELPQPPSQVQTVAQNASISLVFPELNSRVTELVLRAQPARTPLAGFGPTTDLGAATARSGVLAPHGEGEAGPGRVPQLTLHGLSQEHYRVQVSGLDANGVELYQTSLDAEAQPGEADQGFGRISSSSSAAVRAGTPVWLERSMTSLQVNVSTPRSGLSLVARVGGVFTALSPAPPGYSGSLFNVPTQADALIVVEGRDSTGKIVAQGALASRLLPGGNTVQLDLQPSVSISAPVIHSNLSAQTAKVTLPGQDFGMDLSLTDEAGHQLNAASQVRVEWGDGTAEVFKGPFSTLPLKHRYTDSGQYALTVWALSNDGTWGTMTHALTVGQPRLRVKDQGLVTLGVHSVPASVRSLRAVLSPTTVSAQDLVRGVSAYPEQSVDLNLIQGTWSAATLMWRDRPYKLRLFAGTGDANSEIKPSASFPLQLTGTGEQVDIEYGKAFGCVLPRPGTLGKLGCSDNASDDPSPECQIYGQCNQSLRLVKFKPRFRPQAKQWTGGWGALGPGLFCGGCFLGPWGWGSGAVVGGGGSGSMAGAWGDPHISTVDGGQFTSLLLGEFDYLTPTVAPEEGIQLQVRQARLSGLPDWASFNVAAALRAGGHTYQVALPRDRNVSSRLDLSIDGHVTDLASGFYSMSASTVIEVRDDNALNLYFLPTGAKNFIKVYVGTVAENDLVRRDLTSPVVSLHVTANFDGPAAYRGVLGTPDGNTQNEMTVPDGSVASSSKTFMEAWRVRSRAASLFTYGEGQGPETYNLFQDAVAPTQATLQASGKLEQARALLVNVCRADIGAIDATFVESLAVELAAGRSEASMLESGLCADEHVDRAGEAEPAFVNLEFSGQVLIKGTSVPAPGAKVTVLATSGKVLCQTVAAQEGRYGCGISDAASSFPGPLTLTFRVTGRGAPVTLTQTLPVPGADGPTVVTQNVEVEPQLVLHLSGQVLDTRGQAVSGTLEVTRPVVNRAAISSGRYEVYLPLPDGVRNGGLSFSVYSGDRVGSQNASFEVAPDAHGVVELTQDLRMNFAPQTDVTSDPALKNRRLAFTGRVLNGHLKERLGRDLGVPGVRVRVTSTALQGGFCETLTTEDGKYSCAAFLTGDQAFTATLSVDSGGLSRQMTVPVEELPLKGMTLSHQEEVFYKATTLAVTGSAKTSGGEAIEGVRVSAEVAGLTAAPLTATGLSASDGLYAVYLTLPRSASVLSETVKLQAVLKTSSAEITQSADLAFSAPSGELTTLNRDFILQARVLALTGRVTNRLVPGLGVPGARVRVSEQTAGAVCDVTADASGLYRCSLAVGETPLKFSYEVLGYGGSRRDGVPFDPLSVQVGTRGALSQNFELAPATLKLTGQVTDTALRPAAGGTLSVPWNGQSVNLTLNMDGVFTAYLAVPGPQLSGELALSAVYATDRDNLQATGRAPYLAQAGVLTTLTQNLTLNGAILDSVKSAKVTFEGEVRNLLVPGTPLQGVTVQVWGAGSSASLGKICEDTSRPITAFVQYRCTVTLATGRDLTVEYRALFGSQILGTAITRSVTVAQDTASGTVLTEPLSYAPDTLVIRGRVTDLTGRPLAQSRVQLVGSTSFAQGDDEGDYELVYPLAEPTASGRLQLQVTAPGQAADAAPVVRDLDVVAGQGLTTLENVDFKVIMPLASRTLTLSGTVTNGLVTGEQGRLGLPVIVQVAGQGELCRTVTDAAGAYSCVVRRTSPDALNVQYVVGQQVFERRLENLPAPDGERLYLNDFTATPPTLHLTGTVRDINGNAFSSPALLLRGPGTAAPLGTFAAENGQYNWYIAFPAPLKDAALTLSGSHLSGAVGEAALSLSLAAGELKTLSQNLQLRLPEGLGTTLRLSGLVTDEAGSPLALSTVQIEGDLRALVRTDGAGRYSALFALPTSQEYLALRFRVEYGAARLTAERRVSLTLQPGQLNVREQPIGVVSNGSLKLNAEDIQLEADASYTFTADTSSFVRPPQLSWKTSGGEIRSAGTSAVFIAPASLSEQVYVVTVETDGKAASARITVPPVRPVIATTLWAKPDDRVVYAGLPVSLEASGLAAGRARWTTSAGTLSKTEGGSTVLTAPMALGPIEVVYSHAAFPTVRAALTLRVVAPALTLSASRVVARVGSEVRVTVQDLPAYLCPLIRSSLGTVKDCAVSYTPTQSGTEQMVVTLEGAPDLRATVSVETLAPTLSITPQNPAVLPGQDITLEADIRGFNPAPTLRWQASAGTLVVTGNRAVLTAPQTPSNVTVEVYGANQRDVVTVQVVRPEIRTTPWFSGERIILPNLPFIMSGSGFSEADARWSVSGGTLDKTEGNSVTYTPPATPGEVTFTYSHARYPELKQTLTVPVVVPALSFLAPRQAINVGQSELFGLTGVPYYACGQLRTNLGTVSSEVRWYTTATACSVSYSSAVPKTETVTVTLDGFQGVQASTTIETLTHELRVYRTDNWYGNQPVNIGEQATFTADTSGFVTAPDLTWSATGGTIIPTANGKSAVFTAPGAGKEGRYVVTARGDGQTSSVDVVVVRPTPSISLPYVAGERGPVWAGVPFEVNGAGFDGQKGVWSVSAGTVQTLQNNSYYFSTRTQVTPPAVAGPMTLSYGHADYPEVRTDQVVDVIVPQISIEPASAQLDLGEVATFVVKGVPPYECGQIDVNMTDGVYQGSIVLRNLTDCQISIRAPSTAGTHTLTVSFSNVPGLNVTATIETRTRTFTLVPRDGGRVHAGTSLFVDAVGADGRPFKGALVWSSDTGYVDGTSYGAGVAMFSPSTTTGTATIKAQLQADPSQEATATVQVYLDPVQINVAPETAGKVYTGQQKYKLTALRPNGQPYPLEMLWEATGGTLEQSRSATAFFIPGSVPGQVRITARPIGLSEPVGEVLVDVKVPPIPVLNLENGVTSPVRLLSGQSVTVAAKTPNGQPFSEPLIWQFAGYNSSSFVYGMEGGRAQLGQYDTGNQETTADLTLKACLQASPEACGELPVRLIHSPLNFKVRWNGQALENVYDYYGGINLGGFLIGERLEFSTSGQSSLPERLHWTAYGADTHPYAFFDVLDTLTDPTATQTVVGEREASYTVQVRPETSGYGNTDFGSFFTSGPQVQAWSDSNQGSGDFSPRYVDTPVILVLPGQVWSLKALLGRHSGIPAAAWRSAAGSFSSPNTPDTNFTLPTVPGSYSVEYPLAAYPAAGTGVTFEVVGPGLYLGIPAQDAQGNMVPRLIRPSADDTQTAYWIQPDQPDMTFDTYFSGLGSGVTWSATGGTVQTIGTQIRVVPDTVFGSVVKVTGTSTTGTAVSTTFNLSWGYLDQ